MACGYSTSWKVLNAADFGVPQSRERIIIIATRGRAFDFNDLDKSPRGAIVDILEEDGDFEYLEEGSFTLLDNPKKQPSSLIFAGYRNKARRKAGVREGTEHLSRAHKQPNRIYSVEGVHPTLPSQEASGRFFVLTTNGKVRKLTLLECWRLMGFPDDFEKVSSPSE